MSSANLEQHHLGDDRPAEVTDPLLWKLALEVADAHAPDDEGGCRNLGCAGQAWPCAAWNNAQHALQVAQAPADRAPSAGRAVQREAVRPETAQSEADQSETVQHAADRSGGPADPIVAWSADLTTQAGDQRRLAVGSAA
ncbi:hypothetical protein AB0H57_15600 [Micromonospora sp. NPDC050686]|uniref:hypothetical protein n=1 Tax=Micromonospora sp. NPDC050686 TaxID=3154631 RepID=UPI003400CFB6